MGTLLLSRWSWSVHLARGRPGGRFHVGSGGRPTDSSTWRSMAWCAGMLSGSVADFAQPYSGGVLPTVAVTSRTCRVFMWLRRNVIVIFQSKLSTEF